jgi:predicted cupin superfamily sugar epimerase
MLRLEPNIEGGYYRQTYESNDVVITERGPRPFLNTIYYLLTKESPIGHLHRNQSDITHFHHHGGPATYVLISPAGAWSEVVLGDDLAAGQVISFTAPGGWWKASHILARSATNCLISEATSPGFRYDDHEMATPERIAAEHPALLGRLRPLIRASASS